MISPFFSIYLAHVTDVLEAVEEIAGEGISQYLDDSKDESASSWPTLNKYNPSFPKFFCQIESSCCMIHCYVSCIYLMFCQSSGRPSWCSIKCSWQSWKRLPERFLHGKAVTALRSATRCQSNERTILHMLSFRPYYVFLKFCFQAQSEKLLRWNLAVRDFRILVNLVKVRPSRMETTESIKSV